MAKKKPKKKSYLISTNVENASGWQYWRVEATSREEAIELHKKGESEFEWEEVEVTDLGEPEVIEETEIEE